MRTFLVLFLILLPLSVAGRAQDETEKYTLGAGDTLRIDVPGLFGAPQDKPVRRDGTIELSIAGGRLLVAGSTVEEVAAKIKALAANFGDYRASVFVLRYASHPVAATGNVREPGIKYLTRDAVPVYVFRAVSIPDQAAEGVEIQRADGSSIACRFDECERQKIVIRSGDAVRFTANAGVARSDRR
ncbi:MAG: polysaccharide biosynthesis/export family protein [Acidobacteria bacterium]|nr:polysaccharide biosynthesis/export family protein [Acidobacteriota bacterium]